MKQIAKDIDQIDVALRNLSGQDITFARKVAILASIPGIGQLTAITLLIDMPEIGGMDNKKAASLAGLAPVSQSSGKWQGKDSRRSGTTAQGALHAGTRYHTGEPGHDKKVQSAHRIWKREKGRADRYHAEVAGHGKRLATRQSNVDRNLPLTKTVSPP